MLRRVFFATLLLTAAAARAQCPPAVRPASPPEGLVTTETHINFAWTPSGPAVTGYDLWLATNGGQPQRICFNSPSPDCSATLGAGRYEWFVRNFRDDCPSGTESAHAHFSIEACSAPVAPTTLVPDGAVDVGSGGTTLTWSGGAADTYDVFLDQGMSCATTTALNRAPLTGSSSASGPLVRGATYSWRVRASRGSTCPTPVFSRCATFKVRACDPPASFALASPGNGEVVASTVRLQWSAATGATSYNVYARTSANDPFTLAGTTTSTSLYAVFAPSANVEWHVDAISGACVTTSAHRTFVVAGCDVGAPTLIAPSGTITPGSAISFRWNPARNAERYRVWLAPSGGTFAPADDTSDTTASAHRPPGSYDWYVEAMGRACPPAISATGHFVVPRASACVDAPPALASPANGATVTTGDVAFSWSIVANASRYEVWASINHSAPMRLTSRPLTAFTTDLAPGTIEWFVIARADGCDDVRSNTFTFTKQAACDNGVPLLLAPAGGAQRIPTSVDFFWTNVPGASTYKLWSGVDDGPLSVIATTSDLRSHANVATGRIRWFVEAVFPNCGSTRSPEDWFRATASGACALPEAPSISAPAGAPGGIGYELHWSPLPNIDHYEVQRTTDANPTPVLLSTSDVTIVETNDVSAATRYHYRVRGVSNCGAGTGPFSGEAIVLVTPKSASAETTVPYGTADVQRTLFVPGAGSNIRFTATADRPWIVIDPSSGILPPAGITLTLRLLAYQLDTGDHDASIRIDTFAAGKTGGSNGSTSTPVSVTVVTPVSPSASTTAPPAALILPAIAHLDAATSFRSDARLLNSGPRPLRYQLTFVPSGTDGTKAAQSTSVQVNGGSSIALNDLLASFFGAGNSFGSLEIRPVVSAGDFAPPGDVTFASSRTYALTALGTAGQFIPALSLSKFGLPNATQLLAQVAQRGAFRTNVGLVELGAQPASGVLNFFDKSGLSLGSISFNLLPREHVQLDSLVTSSNVLAQAARIEIVPSGRVTAYASILDQQTNDPMLIQALPLASLGSTRYVVPGVAALVASGGQWRSDLQIYNAASSPQSMTVTFTPRDNVAGAQSVNVTLNGREVRGFDDIVSGTFGQGSGGGSVLVTTSAASQLAITARTFFDNGSGTYGQYIPALTPADGAVLGGRAREVLQVEQSDLYRTNLGLAELAGAPATIEITANVLELKSAPVIALTLQPNEFRQLDSILTSLGFVDVHNARLSIRVTAGSGRVGAYGSLVDNLTGDPTLIPAQ